MNGTNFTGSNMAVFRKVFEPKVVLISFFEAEYCSFYLQDNSQKHGQILGTHEWFCPIGTDRNKVSFHISVSFLINSELGAGKFLLKYTKELSEETKGMGKLVLIIRLVISCTITFTVNFNKECMVQQVDFCFFLINALNSFLHGK